MRKKVDQALVMHMIGALCLGASVYFLSRPELYVSALLYGIIGIDPVEISFRGGNLLSTFVRTHVCDMAFAYALVLSLCWLEEPKKWKGIRKAIRIAILGEVVFEAMQYFGLLRGTFDLMDLVWEIGISFVAGAVYQSILASCHRKTYHERNTHRIKTSRNFQQEIIELRQNKNAEY